MMNMNNRLKLIFAKLAPKIHNLPQVIYIQWLGYEWIIEKN